MLDGVYIFTCRESALGDQHRIVEHMINDSGYRGKLCIPLPLIVTSLPMATGAGKLVRIVSHEILDDGDEILIE